MGKGKILAIVVLCAAGFGLNLVLVNTASGTAKAVDPEVTSNTLAKEMKALCDEIKLLRLQIQELRKAIVTMQQRHPQSSIYQPVEKEPVTIESPPLPVVGLNFTQVPSEGKDPDSRGNISGKVIGLDAPNKYKIVLYALTDRWYVQPLVDSPLTRIKRDGTWSNWTHLGHRYAAVLVRSSFKPEPKVQVLPRVGGDIIAVAEEAARQR